MTIRTLRNAKFAGSRSDASNAAAEATGGQCGGTKANFRSQTKLSGVPAAGAGNARPPDRVAAASRRPGKPKEPPVVSGNTAEGIASASTRGTPPLAPE
jgi:hypothetical protein